MPVIGLTGTIASGKSLVSKILIELGARVIDADVVAREIVQPGTIAWHKIRSAFGDKVLNSDMSINRRILGEIVFNESECLKRLNEITHPEITGQIGSVIDAFRARATENEEVLILEAPLLIETGLWQLVDEIWLVDIPEEVRVQRLTERDGLTREEALKRINSQMPACVKREYAHVIIDNSGDTAYTRKIVQELWDQRIRKSGRESVGD